MTDVRENVLKIQLLKIAEKHGYNNPEFKIVPIPVTGFNFTSELFRGTISEPGKENLNVFAKVAVLCEAVRKLMPNKMFDIERYVYTKLLVTYKELEEKHKVPEQHRLAMPNFYGYSETYLEEVIVLEDLSIKGFTTYDRFKPIEWDYAATSIEQLAKMHGLSLAFQKEYPDDYEEAKTILKTQSIDIGEGNNEQTMWKVVNQALQLVHEEHRPKIQKLFNQKFDPATFMNNSGGKRKVIVHGDFKQGNLMHKDENGKLQVIIVDYQTLRPSSAASDLLYFVFNCADGQFRKEYFHKLIDHYYQHMTAVLRRLHLDPEEVYPRANFDEELKEMLPTSLINSLIVLPVFYMDQTDVRQLALDESAESLTSMMMKPSALCALRINEVVDDCVQWGVL